MFSHQYDKVYNLAFLQIVNLFCLFQVDMIEEDSQLISDIQEERTNLVINLIASVNKAEKTGNR